MPPIKISLLVALTMIVEQVLTPSPQTPPKVDPATQTLHSTELLLLKDAIVAEILTKTQEDKGWEDPTVLVPAFAVLVSFGSLVYSDRQFRRQFRANHQAKLLDSLRVVRGRNTEASGRNRSH